MNRQLLGDAIVIPADERGFLAAHYERCGNKHMAEEVRSDNYRVGWGMSEASFIQAIRDAVAAKDARIATLEKALEPFASQHTVGETLMTCEAPPWAGLSPEQRLAMLAERKETHDANILNARALLNPTPTEER